MSQFYGGYPPKGPGFSPYAGSYDDPGPYGLVQPTSAPYPGNPSFGLYPGYGTQEPPAVVAGEAGFPYPYGGYGTEVPYGYFPPPYEVYGIRNSNQTLLLVILIVLLIGGAYYFYKKGRFYP